MAKLKFRTISKRTVDALVVEDRDEVFWDDRIPGFGVRVYPSGSRVYVVQTRHKGKSRRVTLGRHGVITA
ncbi:MAG: Arm DNA-binding domain-containing protein, partial [Defluviicoccus sp.]|nr:Arm DNA-binding domain-containing protein [Defluviicoccus sp.]